MKRLLIAIAALGATAIAIPAAAQAFGPGRGPNAGYGWSQGCGGPGFMMGRGGGYGRAAMMNGAGPRGMMATGNPAGRGGGRLTAIDTNRDGAITAEEAATAADEVFATMDADDDGSLTKDEYMAVRMGPGNGWNTARQAARQTLKQDRFAVIDADHDGRVSRAEFIEGARAHFSAADTDGDGQVTPWEFRQARWN
ncbi:EF-hand domain-containing protein [Consotaella salsifontis]|uniref:Ca2+-binding protein, EF-hand superfamily n=1 Tax=Consotaella salsifontis TaxID=1365950 RepID=A0A1T4S6M4_9HYPH|nr:EF-hand domain-containing protein [Consotaella salsifontis]SKA23885.1 Ca2+-binding protein, EF-hand superfamily [Consotaella salsifontis]